MQQSIRKNYSSLDIAKFICAILIISAHFASERGHFPVMVDYIFSIYIVAVPFFFCSSGFLFFQKLKLLPSKEEKRSYFIQYQKRIWLMYLCWTLAYFPFVIVECLRNSDPLMRFFKWLHSAVVFQTYSTIWFLPALAVGIAICYFFITRSYSMKKIIVISAILYIIGALGYTYSFLIADIPVISDIYKIYMKVFITIRNGLFNGFPIIALGAYLAQVPEQKKEPVKYGLLTCLSLLLMVLECFILKLKFQTPGVDICLFVIPVVYFSMKFLLCIDLKERKVYYIMRKLSLLMFTCQRLFLTALPLLFPVFFNEYLWKNSYIGLIVTNLIIIGFSYLVWKLSDRYKYLKYLM